MRFGVQTPAMLTRRLGSQDALINRAIAPIVTFRVGNAIVHAGHDRYATRHTLWGYWLIASSRRDVLRIRDHTRTNPFIANVAEASRYRGASGDDERGITVVFTADIVRALRCLGRRRTVSIPNAVYGHSRVKISMRAASCSDNEEESRDLIHDVPPTRVTRIRNIDSQSRK